MRETVLLTPEMWRPDLSGAGKVFQVQLETHSSFMSKKQEQARLTPIPGTSRENQRKP